MSARLVKIMIVLVSLIIAAVIGTWAGGKYNQRRVLNNRKILEPIILKSVTNIHIGKQIEDWYFENLNFESVTLKGLIKHKRTMLIFIDPECNSCLEDLELINSLIRSESDYEKVILISSGNPRLLRDISIEYSSKFVFLYDHKEVFSSQFNITTFPFHIVVDENMNVETVISGSLTKEDVKVVLRNHGLGG